LVIVAEKRKLLAATPVKLQVRDAKHARSKDVVKFCRDHLIAGGTWEELRHQLGLGPAWQDNRWRVVRSMMVDALLPKSDEEAFIAAESERRFLLSKLEEFRNELEERMNDMRGGKTEHHYWKVKLDALKLHIEEVNKSFENFVEVKKVRNLESKNQGVSIIVQNNYHMARPGEEEPVEVTKKVTNLALESDGKNSSNQ
jgi:hypothetical protein